MIMALKRAVPAEETTNTNTTAEKAVETVKETVSTVETAAADTAKESQAKEGELVDGDAQLADEGALKDAAPEAEPEAEAAASAEAAIEPEQIRDKAVAVQTESPVALSNTERQAGAARQFSESMAEQGFEGLNLTGMSFDRVKLDEGKFLLGSEETEIGEQIDVNILSTRNIYIVRQGSFKDAELFYSYDKKGLTHSDGTSAQATLDEWAEEGYGVEGQPLDIKEYIEAMAQLKNRDDEYDEHMVSLSIPPASKDRVAGAFAVGTRKYNCAPGQLIIQCSVGKKIGTGDKAFRPWNFKAIGVNE
jgi:hypothetical protein